MGFLKDVAIGFATAQVAQDERTAKKEDEVDLHRKKSLINLDIYKQESDYKDKKAAEARAARDKEYEDYKQKKTAEQVGQVFTPGSGSAQPTPSSPFNMAPDTLNANPDFEDAQSWREKQARAQFMGDDDIAKFAKTNADIADERMKFSDKTREKERQDILSSDGLPILKLDAEAKVKKYKEPSVISEYGRGVMLRDAKEFKTKLQEEQKDDILNDSLKSILAGALTNEVTGKLTVDAGTFDRFSKDAIILSNELALVTSAEDKEKISLELLDLKSDINAKQTGLGDTVFEALASQGKVLPDLSSTLSEQEPKAKPVELSVDKAPAQTPAFKEGQTATNPATKQKMIFKGGTWQPL